MTKKTIKKNAVGKVTEAEKNEIKFLFERKNGLTELFKIVSEPSHPLYEKLVQDMGETSTKFQKWWDNMSDKYNWKGAKEHHWEINFETCEIYIIKDK